MSAHNTTRREHVAIVIPATVSQNGHRTKRNWSKHCESHQLSWEELPERHHRCGFRRMLITGEERKELHENGERGSPASLVANRRKGTAETIAHRIKNYNLIQEHICISVNLLGSKIQHIHENYPLWYALARISIFPGHLSKKLSEISSQPLWSPFLFYAFYWRVQLLSLHLVRCGALRFTCAGT